MNKKFTLYTAVNFQGMEQRTAHLQTSLSLNLFNKLKWISFVILLVASMNHLKAQFDNVYVPTGTIVPPPFQTDVHFQKFPPFTLLPSSQPTYRLGFGLPPAPDAIPLLVEGNIGTNHSFSGTFGTVGGTARWNAIGDRVPLGALPYISTTGFRSTWESFGLNVGLSQTYSGVGRDALISWQDATVLNPLLASNRLVFGVRDSSTTNFQELGQFRSNGTFGIGFNDLVISSTFTFDQKLELYDFSSNTLFQRWRTITSSPTGGARIGIDNTNQFQIRNEESANIEFWTNNNPQVYINEQPGATPFLGVGTAGPINIPALSGSITGFTPNSGPSVIIPMLSVSGSGTFNGSLGVIGDVYSLSDERLKENFNSLDYDWKKILNVNSYSYQFKKTEGINLSEGMKYGFKAQEVNEIIPELTSVFANGLSINYQGFIPFITQGLKEHEDRIAAIEEVKETEKHILEQVKLLENENQELKTQNELLKERLEALEGKFETICQLPCLKEISAISDNANINVGVLELMDNAILYQNEPNPFTSSTVIRYYLPEGTKNSTITVKNTEGKIVGEYQNLISGNGSISIEPGKLAANTYYYSLIIDGIEVETKKMILIR